MASIINKPNGTREIQFTDPDRKRKTVRLGKCGPATAAEIKQHIEVLVECWAFPDTPVERNTIKWLSKLMADSSKHWLYDRLAGVGLVTARDIPEAVEAAKLGAFLDAYIEGRTDTKPRTILSLKQVRGRLVEFFGADKPIPAITPADADDFRRWLESKIGDNTTRRACGRCKQFFHAAARRRIIPKDENPFADMKDTTVRANRERDFFITREVAYRVLEACPDLEWRLLFALSRFGGLRCPSEHLALKLGHVDWERGRITITSPKTEHHEGKESRIIPLFPELRPLLEQAFDEAPDGAEYFIRRYRDTNANLRTQLKRILRKAGVEPWPKLFQNLRASRETELAEQHPAHIVAAWMGHSMIVSAKHYLQVRDSDFEKAMQPEAKSEANGGDFLPSAKQGAKHENTEKPVFSRVSDTPKVARPGLEPGTPR